MRRKLSKVDLKPFGSTAREKLLIVPLLRHDSPGFPGRVRGAAVVVAIAGICLLGAMAPAGARGGGIPPSGVPLTRVAANQDAPDLSTLLILQQAQVPAATVTAGFYDWRAVSKYRRQAGLHLGYDIAMPAGSPAVAGWTGQVTRVTPWWGAEHGVTVVSSSGFEVTYGHITPTVRVGDVLNPGDPVGRVVVDHVDVKMRGPDGLYFDYGHSAPPAGGVAGLPPGIPLGYWGGRVGPLTRDEGLRLYLTSIWSARLGHEEVLQAKDVEAEARSKYESERKRVSKTRDELPRLREFLQEGLIARVEVERAEARVASAGGGLASLERQWRVAQRDLAFVQARTDASRRQADAARKALSRLGVGDAQLNRALAMSLEKPGGEALRLRKMKAEAAARQKTLSRQRQERLGRARQDMERMQALFEQGAVSRVERDRARQRYESLRRAGS